MPVPRNDTSVSPRAARARSASANAIHIVAALLLSLYPLPGTAARADGPSAEEAGQRLFIRCAACHATSADSRPMAGPHLASIVDRPVASIEGFTYTDALRHQSFIWNEKQLDRLLHRPQSIAPGLCLPFTGMAKPEDRAALIAYLKNPGL